MMLDCGNLLLKTLYIETVSLTNLLNGKLILEEGNIANHSMTFQIEGSTIIHLYALNKSQLSFVLDYFNQNSKEYLNAILQKNYAGETPIDIAIDDDSPKCIEILLRYLANISETMYSNQLFKRFSKLLQMNLKSFHVFLSGCKFQTVQMKSMKYLSIKGGKSSLVVPNNSCILDRSFIEKHTIRGQANKELRQRQKEIFQKETRYLREQRKFQTFQRKRRLNKLKQIKDKVTLIKSITKIGREQSRPKTREKGGKNYEVCSEPSHAGKDSNREENKNQSNYTLEDKDSANYESSDEEFSPAKKMRINFFSFLKLRSLQYDKQSIQKLKEDMKLK